ncbi:MAG: hypothetical protein ACRC1L_10005, partial [Prochlorococcaceae cyanobacterium]
RDGYDRGDRDRYARDGRDRDEPARYDRERFDPEGYPRARYAPDDDRAPAPAPRGADEAYPPRMPPARDQSPRRVRSRVPDDDPWDDSRLP